MAYIAGTSGSDTINGTAGNDHIAAGAGRDLLYGGAGTDIIEGGKGHDYMEGGSGSDTFRFYKGDLVIPSAETNNLMDRIGDFTGAGSHVAGRGDDYLQFIGFDAGSYLSFMAFHNQGAANEDQTKQYYGVYEADGDLLGMVFVEMTDGTTAQLIAGVDYFGIA